jgi:hypothetical protein
MVSKAGRESVSQVRRYNIQQFIQGSRGFTRLCLKISILSRVQSVKETESTYAFFERSLDRR